MATVALPADTRRSRPEHVRNSELGRPATFLEAIREALWEEMERDPDVFLMGEDIGAYGGAFKVTDGFLQYFGEDRVRDRKSTRLNSSHSQISYAVFCLKKKKKKT